MAGRTKLYQQAKSPLIQGFSKHERPSWQPWLGGTVAGALAAVAIVAGIAYLRSGVLAELRTLIVWSALALVGSALGSSGWIWLGRRMGWRQLALGGAVAGALVAVALTYGASAWLISRL